MRSKRANFYKAPYSNIDLFLNENTMIHVHCSRYIPDGVIISYELPFILKFIYPVESYLGYKSANLFSVLLLLQSDIRFFLCFLSNNVVYILIYKDLLTSQGFDFVLIREYILCLYRIVIMCHASQHATSLKNQVRIFSLSRNVRLTMPYYLRDLCVLTASSLRTKLKPVQ